MMACGLAPNGCPCTLSAAAAAAQNGFTPGVDPAKR
jgi:hypothetical protein